MAQRVDEILKSFNQSGWVGGSRVGSQGLLVGIEAMFVSHVLADVVGIAQWYRRWLDERVERLEDSRPQGELGNANLTGQVLTLGYLRGNGLFFSSYYLCDFWTCVCVNFLHTSPRPY